MSGKERLRLEVLSKVRGGQLTLSQGAALLGLSYRQMRRVSRRHSNEGDAGPAHRLRGKASNRKTGAAAREAVSKLYRRKYAGLGPTLACEYPAKEGHAVSHDKLGRRLRVEGLFERRRKRGKHRSRRERRDLAGEWVQMDGSWHDGFEGRGGVPWCCLMVMVDAAGPDVGDSSIATKPRTVLL